MRGAVSPGLMLGLATQHSSDCEIASRGGPLEFCFRAAPISGYLAGGVILYSGRRTRCFFGASASSIARCAALTPATHWALAQNTKRFACAVLAWQTSCGVVLRQLRHLRGHDQSITSTAFRCEKSPIRCLDQ